MSPILQHTGVDSLHTTIDQLRAVVETAQQLIDKVAGELQRGEAKGPEVGPLKPRVEYLSRKQVSEMLNISRATLDYWARRGKGPKFVQSGRVIRYRQDEVEKWIESRRGGEE